jgi:uncharacterized glyoxalase superfamily protein PhnB
MAIDVRGLCPYFEVYDMPASLRFYRDALGFEVKSTSPARSGADRFHWVWLRHGSAELMLNTAYEFDEERPAVEDAGRLRGHGDCCLYLACPDVDAAYAELRGKGVAVQKPKVAPYGMKQLYLKDPDGYGICMQWAAAPE